MKVGLILGIIFAVLLHVGFILFGGLFFIKSEKDLGRLQQVELLSDDAPKKEDEKKETPPEELKSEDEAPPNADKILKDLESPPNNDRPELVDASLAAIEAALNGAGDASGDFASAMDFASGGRIGGTGKAGSLDESLENAFSLAEIDQKPRAVFQSAPVYPSEMRGKKVEGVVTVLFVVDSAGKVANPHVEKSNNPAFERPALDAVKRWKFEPAVKGGQRVACKMRVPMRFQPS